MIKHTFNAGQHEVTPLTDKAARFLNTFVGRTLILDDKDWENVQMEMGAHGVWVMGSDITAIGMRNA